MTAVLCMTALRPPQSKHMRRALYWAAFVGVLLPLLYICLGLAGGLWSSGDARKVARADAVIGLIAGPIHYDLLIPLTPDTRARFGFALAAGVPVGHPGARWLLVGWGARGFYTSTATLADMEAATVWKAATGDSAVMRLDVLGPIGDIAEISRIKVSDAEMTDLVTAVLASLASTTALPLLGFTETDAFFPAHGRFHLLNTCNVWIGDVLRAAGLPFGRWTPFPQSIRLSLGRAKLDQP